MATDNDRLRVDNRSEVGHPGYSRNATIVLLLGLLTTGITTWSLHHVVHNKDIERFQNNVASTQDVIADRLDVYVSLLRSAAAFFAASERVSRDQFRAYVERLEVTTAFPGIQGIGFARYVPAGELAEFTQAVRDDGSAEFRVWPEGERSGYYPILYLEPLDRRNQAAIGYDMFTESSRQAAMSKARDTGRPAASGKVTLVQEIEKHKQAGFLVYVPVYAGGSVPDSQEERRKQLMGFVYSPFRAGDLLTGVFSSADRPRIDFTIFDGESARDEARLYESGAQSNPRFSVTKRMQVAGRPWTLSFATRPEFEAASSRAFVPGVLLIGTLLSLLIAGITGLEARARRNAEATEAKQEFLIKLDDAVRALDAPEEITSISARLLGEYLQVDRCAYADVEEDQDTFNLTGDYNRGVESIVGRYRFTQFGESALSLMRSNLSYVVSDITTDARRPSDLSAYERTSIRAVICVPLHKRGRFVAAMAVHQTQPRQWQSEEADLVSLVANRCWESIERARVARNLKQSEEKFRQLANSIPQLAWMAAPDGFIFWYNDRWCDYTGMTSEQTQGWNWQTVHDPAELPRVLETWTASLATGTPWEELFPLRRHDGAYRWHLSRALPLKDSDNRVVLWFGTNTDVTDQRRLMEEREQLLESEREARAAAERAGRMKDEFLATLSHELRTPLTSILGYATLLRMTKLNEADLEEATAAIERNARLQAKLIEDLLDMNRIVSGKIRLELKKLYPAAVLEETASSASAIAEEQGVELIKTIDPDAGPIVADPVRLQQITWNLLSNAIKFTPAGGQVRLSLEQTPECIQISVSDTGNGISADFLPHVFDRFRQADGSTTRRYGGLGLGLSIVRQLVELHGGSVRVESGGEGAGSSFTVTLPICTDNASANLSPEADPSLGQRPQTTEAMKLQGVKVLVVDDESDAAAVVKRMLEQCEVQVVHADSAQAARDILARQSFDLLLSDIGMPQEDGYQFIRRLRSEDVPYRNIPAAAFTAFARPEDKARAEQAGFQAHLSKPVELADLIALVSRLVHRSLGTHRDR